MLDERLVNGAELSVEAIEEAASPRPFELVADGPLDELLDVPLTCLGLDSLDALWGQLPRRSFAVIDSEQGACSGLPVFSLPTPPSTVGSSPTAPTACSLDELEDRPRRHTPTLGDSRRPRALTDAHDAAFGVMAVPGGCPSVRRRWSR